MNKSVLTTFLILCFTALYAQTKIKGNGNIKIQNTVVEEFETLSIGNELEVVLVKSQAPSVTIEADENLIPIINFKVENGILRFNIDQKVTRSKRFKAEIRYSDKLKNIILNDDVNVTSQSDIQLPALNLTLNDDSKIEAEIIADNFSLTNNHDESFKISTNCKLKIETKEATLDLKQNSNNDITIKSENLSIKTYDNAELNIQGFSYNLDILASQSSDINAKELLSNNANLKIDNKAAIYLNVSDSLHLNASGTSKINLYGKPKISIEAFENRASLVKKEL